MLLGALFLLLAVGLLIVVVRLPVRPSPPRKQEKRTGFMDPGFLAGSYAAIQPPHDNGYAAPPPSFDFSSSPSPSWDGGSGFSGGGFDSGGGTSFDSGAGGSGGGGCG